MLLECEVQAGPGDRALLAHPYRLLDLPDGGPAAADREEQLGVEVAAPGQGAPVGAAPGSGLRRHAASAGRACVSEMPQSGRLNPGWARLSLPFPPPVRAASHERRARGGA